MSPQEPTVRELEEAITHLRATIKRYGPHAHKYAEWHEELNHLLTDRDDAIAKDRLLTPIAPVE